MLEAKLEALWKGEFSDARDDLSGVCSAHEKLAGAAAGEDTSLADEQSSSNDAFAAKAVATALFSLLARDIPKLHAMADALTQNDSEYAARWRPVIHAWSEVSRGKLVNDLVVPAPGTGNDATAARIFANCAVIFSALTHGDLQTALALARVTATEARQSRLPQVEYMAFLTLARVRRYRGQTHLATRILSALGRVVPPVWKNWLQWELTLSGGISALSANDASAELAPVFHALRTNDDDALHHARDRLRECVVGFAPWAHDADTLLGMIAQLPAHAPRIPAADAWAAGEPNVTAHAVRHASIDEIALRAWVVARRDTPPRRVLAYTPQGSAGLHQLSDGEQGGRTEMALAALLLAGRQGLFVDDAFERVYGFHYKAAVHDGVFRVLLTRVRQALGEHGELVRDGDLLRIDLARDVCVVDPRDEAENANDVLRAIAQQKKTSARELAEALNKPLRTVQAELARLVADGACSRKGNGPRVSYVVEDTVFSEPTRKGTLEAG